MLLLCHDVKFAFSFHSLSLRRGRCLRAAPSIWVGGLPDALALAADLRCSQVNSFSGGSLAVTGESSSAEEPQVGRGETSETPQIGAILGSRSSRNHAGAER